MQIISGQNQSYKVPITYMECQKARDTVCHKARDIVSESQGYSVIKSGIQYLSESQGYSICQKARDIVAVRKS